VESLELPPGFVLVCHSLGLHLLSPGLLAKAGLVVIISGFAHFHGVHAEDGRFSRRHIGKMRSRLRKEPEGLIRDFHRDCAYPHSPPDPRAMDTELLARDLTLLDQGRLTAERCQGIPPALILHGRDDRIVRPERARELAEMLPASRVVIIDHAGHGLPFTHPGLCLDLIRAAYQALSIPPHDRP
jgi:pimeloyl-ACP methyl ester carboxylesterase